MKSCMKTIFFVLMAGTLTIGKSAFCEDAPGSAPIVEQPVINPPPPQSQIQPEPSQTNPSQAQEIDSATGLPVVYGVNGVEYHDKASFEKASSEWWQGVVEKETQKAVSGGYIVGINGKEYGSPETFAKRDYERGMTYIKPDGTSVTYGDGYGNFVSREQFMATTENNFSKMKTENERIMKEMLAAGVDPSDPEYQNALSANEMFDARVKEISDELRTVTPLNSSSNNSRMTVLRPSVIGGMNANKPQITILNNMGVRNSLTESTATSTTSQPLTNVERHGIGLSRPSTKTEPQKLEKETGNVQKPRVLVSG